MADQDARISLPPASPPGRSAIELYLKPRLGDLQLHEVRLGHLEDLYREVVAGGLSVSRVQRIHAIASVALGEAVRRGLIASNPASAARAPRGGRPDPDPPQPDEVALLLATARREDPDLFAFLLVAANTGARRGEICGLRWSDVDVGRGTVTIARAVVKGGGEGAVVRQTKTGVQSVKALQQGVVDALAEHRERQEERAASIGLDLVGHAYLWTQDVEGLRPVYPDSITGRFRKLRTSAGLPHVQMRQLRHFAATQLLAAGVDIRTVAGRLGRRLWAECNRPGRHPGLELVHAPSAAWRPVLPPLAARTECMGGRCVSWPIPAACARRPDPRRPLD